ncbi:MAG: hypothetical protein ACLU1X_05905 [Peptoniphilus grossensis]|uniref:hypothetical protein n=1 Tax=Anaerococcus vaginalis TaxID=33037 RepID=UPI001D1B2C2C|nr:hypothetical protein [Anaerococcus vaginalis]MBS4889415.1 hypothetical protein [Anaerococcus vaginalis]
MLNVEKLRQDREKAFDIWFEKWWEKEKLESKIKKANLTGYRGYVVTMSDYEANEQIWMRKEEFLLKLQDMLPDFRVEYKYAKNIFTKNDFLYGIRIEW